MLCLSISACPRQAVWGRNWSDQNQNSDAKIVVTKGYLDPEAETQLVASGVRHYKQKPYSLDEIIRAVEKALAHA